jgi:hypothetical protein
MTSYVVTSFHHGSAWLLLACVVLFVGTVVGLMTETGSGIISRPYTNPYDGGALGSDLPPGAIGHADLEPYLPRRRR